MKIAIVAPVWYEIPPGKYGGIEWICYWLTEGLSSRGNEVFLIGAGSDRTSATFFSTYKPPPTERLGEVRPEAVHQARAYSVLEDLEVDIVHDHSFLGPMMARSRATPTVVTVHTPVQGELGEYYGSFGSGFRLVAISDNQRELAPQLPWFATVRNGIPVKQYPFQEHKENFLVFLGRLSPEKGPHFAIQSARQAGVPLIIAAKCQEPRELEYFESYVKPELGPGVDYIGEADIDTKKDLLGRAQALVNPIQWEEPFGLVMAEALACGTPVVAFNRGSVPEIVSHEVTGIVCSNPEELPQAIRDVGKIDPKACRQRAEDLFDSGAMVEGYEAVFRQTLLETAS